MRFVCSFLAVKVFYQSLTPGCNLAYCKKQGKEMKIEVDLSALKSYNPAQGLNQSSVYRGVEQSGSSLGS